VNLRSYRQGEERSVAVQERTWLSVIFSLLDGVRHGVLVGMTMVPITGLCFADLVWH